MRLKDKGGMICHEVKDIALRLTQIEQSGIPATETQALRQQLKPAIDQQCSGVQTFSR